MSCLALAAASPSGRARSSELVHIRSAPAEPTEFLKPRAKAMGTARTVHSSSAPINRLRRYQRPEWQRVDVPQAHTTV
jgi:hypothetical protein